MVLRYETQGLQAEVSFPMAQALLSFWGLEVALVERGSSDYKERSNSGFCMASVREKTEQQKVSMVMLP